MAKSPKILIIETLKNARSRPSLSQDHLFSGEGKQEISVDCAKIVIDQTNNPTTSRKPRFEFHITFDVKDDRHAAIFEWANCFWSKGEYDDRILRKVTLYFNYTSMYEDMPDRRITIERAFLAKYDEINPDQDEKNNKPNPPKVEIIIRANEEDQAIDMEQILTFAESSE